MLKHGEIVPALPILLALLTQTEDCEVIEAGSELVAPLNLIAHVVEDRGIDVNHGMAALANQVVVLVLAGQGVHHAVLSQAGFADQPDVAQPFQGAINGGCVDA